MRILVIDDEIRDFLFLQQNLASAGIGNLEYAASGEEGVELAKREPIDLVILDKVMKGMDGFATCAKIKEIDSGRVKVIMFTGIVNPVVPKYPRGGADFYCVKTFDFVPLINLIKKINKSE